MADDSDGVWTDVSQLAVENLSKGTSREKKKKWQTGIDGSVEFRDM
jgi:hypothetical protein